MKWNSTTAVLLVMLASLLVGSPSQADAQASGGGAPSPLDAAPEWVKPPIGGPNLHYQKFHSALVKADVSYVIYLPEEYEKSKNTRYPVVYWLHGKGGSQQGVPGFARGFNEAIAAGKCPPLLVVYVNGLPLGGYADSPDGRQPVESYIIKDLVPHIDASYRTIARREGRMIEGFSMGGSGAAKMGFKYPDLFGSISIFAGALHDADSLGGRNGDMLDRVYGGRASFDAQSNPWKLAERNADQVRGHTPVRITVGGRDPLQRRNLQFHELLNRLKIEHEFTVVDDAPHSPAPLYEGLGDKNWQFYTRAFGALNGTAKSK